MINYTTLNSNLKRGILNFSEKISKKFSRPVMKFICNMIYGILASKSCLLSEIGRNLNEKIPLKKTVTRLSRNLNDFDGGEELFEAYMKTIKTDTMIKVFLLLTVRILPSLQVLNWKACARSGTAAQER